ncbi:MAG: hypothetical protein AAGF11_18520 [Myxococcota bacterium]
MTTKAEKRAKLEASAEAAETNFGGVDDAEATRECPPTQLQVRTEATVQTLSLKARHEVEPPEGLKITLRAIIPALDSEDSEMDPPSDPD